MEPTRPTGITGKARETLARILHHVLVDECSLSATTRDYRWRVTGPNLYSLHRLFEEQRRQLDYWMTQLFERTRATGVALATELEKVTSDSVDSASPVSPECREPRSMIGDLLARHEAMAETLREDIA